MTAPRAAILCMVLALAGCTKARNAQGEKLARTFCAACHAFPEPGLLGKATWQSGVLPKMALRLGVSSGSLYAQVASSPYMTVLDQPLPREDWDKIVAYYLAS